MHCREARALAATDVYCVAVHTGCKSHSRLVVLVGADDSYSAPARQLLVKWHVASTPAVAYTQIRALAITEAVSGAVWYWLPCTGVLRAPTVVEGGAGLELVAAQAVRLADAVRSSSDLRIYSVASHMVNALRLLSKQ